MHNSASSSTSIEINIFNRDSLVKAGYPYRYYTNRGFWCEGYYVDTAGKNVSQLVEYAQNQLKEDGAG